jgi:6-pyruvoyltetrahydropterin/6-carboxytetrahydropterin synthase|tara:strand:- start:1049 stop:1471 length:423 start_codon:yes stop_codon:yes gene_type:complete
MKEVTIIRRERFSSAHKLWNPKWSEEKNNSTFGGCSNPNWHGHNYELIVKVKGEIDPETGFVMNLKDLSKILKSKVIDKLDHKNLNLDVDFLKDKNTTTEVVAVSIWEEIEKDIEKKGAKLVSVKINETENNSVEYFGEN